MGLGKEVAIALNKKLSIVEAYDTFEVRTVEGEKVESKLTEAPVLTARNASATEGTDIVITVSNYESGFTYNDLVVTAGTIVDNEDGTYLWTMPMLDEGFTSVEMKVKAEDVINEKHPSENGAITLAVTVVSSADAVVLYENETINTDTFTILNGVDVANGTLKATATNAVAESAVIVQDAEDGDFTKAQATVTSTAKKFPIKSGTTAEKVVVGTQINDGEKILVGDGILKTVDTTGKVTEVLIPAVVGATPGGNEHKLVGKDPEASCSTGRDMGANDTITVIGSGSQETEAGTYGGEVSIYYADGTLFKHMTSADNEAGDYFGEAIALSDDKMAIAATRWDGSFDNVGKLYVYDLEGNEECQIKVSGSQAKNDYLGMNGALSLNATKIAAGAQYRDSSAGAAYIWDIDGSNQIRLDPGELAGGDRFGYSVEVGDTKVFVGATRDDTKDTDAGAVYSFNLDGTGVQKMLPDDDNKSGNYGMTIAAGYGKVVIGAPYVDEPKSNVGKVYIYDEDGSNKITIQADELMLNGYFGCSVAITEKNVIVGSYYGNFNSIEKSGRVYMYDHNGENEQIIECSEPEEEAYFGWAVAGTKSSIVASAIRQNGGADGDVDRSGAVYTYDIGSPSKDEETVYEVDVKKEGFSNVPTTVARPTSMVKTSMVASGAAPVYKGTKKKSCTAVGSNIVDVYEMNIDRGTDLQVKVEMPRIGDEILKIEIPVDKV